MSSSLNSAAAKADVIDRWEAAGGVLGVIGIVSMAISGFWTPLACLVGVCVLVFGGLALRRRGYVRLGMLVQCLSLLVMLVPMMYMFMYVVSLMDGSHMGVWSSTGF